MSEKIYLAALHKIGFTHKEFFRIFEKNTNFKDFYNNLSYKVLKQYSISDKKISKVLDLKNKISLKKIEKTITNLKISIILHNEKSYPENLTHIFNPPFLFYLRWNLIWNSISFIGSRNISNYWKKVIEFLIPKVWNYFSIISGWAMWCDSYSHKIALENNIKTLSVFGTWIDIFYPSSSIKIFEKILKNNWWLISIFPLWEPWTPYNFPIRNEIVAGLSSWVVVIEAQEKSGSLITAKLALDLWKDLFSVPGEIFKLNSVWCNKLIRDWEAKAVLEAEDILFEYNIKNLKKEEKKIIFNNKLEEDIYNLLLLESLWIDEITEKLNISFDDILLKLSMMELSQFIKKWNLWKYEIF